MTAIRARGAADPLGDRLVDALHHDGFAVLPAAVRDAKLRQVGDELERLLHQDQVSGAHAYRRSGGAYAARNLLDAYPDVVAILAEPVIRHALASLGDGPFGVVRALFLDKPPGRTWAIPWHQDVTIAVEDNTLPSAMFTKPTTKAGVQHVEAPAELLERMIIVRIHLDPVTPDNGPMLVVPGSHRKGKLVPEERTSGEPLLHDAGDVLLIRPLVVHRSVKSTAGVQVHRRVVHLELAPTVDLPDGYRWHRWVLARPAAVSSESGARRGAKR